MPLLDDVYDAIHDVLPTFRHLAPQGTTRPYIVLNLLPGPLYRCFVAAETFERLHLQVTLWYEWEQDDTEAQSDSCIIQRILDMQEMGGIILFLAQTPGFYVNDADKGRRTLQVVQDYTFERVRTLPCVLSSTS